MHNTVLLTKILLRQSIDLMLGVGERRGKSKRVTTRRRSLIGTGIAFAIVAVIFGTLGYFAEQYGGALGIGPLLLTLLLLMVGIMTFFMAIPAVLSTFYASSDIEELLPLPIKSFSIVTAKGISALLASYSMPVMFMLGPLLGWGISAGAGVGYWLSTVVLLLFVPVIPFSYAGVFSVLVATVFKGLRRKETITTLTTVLSLGIALVFLIISQLMQGEESLVVAIGIAKNLNGMLAMFPAYPFAVEAMSGSLGALGLFAIISVAVFVVFVVFSQFFYLRTVTSLSSGGKRVRAYAGTTAKQQSSFGALLKVDFKKIVHTSVILLNQVVYPVIIIVIVTIPMMWNFVPAMVEMQQSGAPEMILVAIMVPTVLGITAFIGFANRLASNAISREGSCWAVMKTIPVPYEQQIRAKMAMGFAVDAIIVVYQALLFGIPVVSAGCTPLLLVTMIVMGISMAWLSSSVSIGADAASPNVDWGNDGDIDNKKGANNGGMIRGFLVKLVFALLPLIVLLGLPVPVMLVVLIVFAVVAGIFGGNFAIKRAAAKIAAFEG